MPFGEVRLDVAEIDQTDLGYTSQRQVAGLGLMDYRARMYDPGLGRFAQPDTIVPSLIIPQTLNRYTYAANNPIRYVDPDGHCGPLCVITLIGYLLILGSIPGDTPPYEPCSGCDLMFWAGVSILSVTNPAVEAAANTYDCLNGFCLPEFWGAPGSWSGYSQAVSGTTIAAETSFEVSQTIPIKLVNNHPAVHAETLAEQLIDEGLGSPNAPNLIQSLTELATQNPSAGVVSLGSYELYRRPGYTYFDLPGNSYSILQNGGDEFVDAVNEQFMVNQIGFRKPFEIRLINPMRPGAGTRLELSVLSRAVQAGIYAETIPGQLFVPK